MRQFSRIFKFELFGYLKNKVFMGVTIFLVVALAIIMFFPRLIALNDDGGGKADLPDMLVVSYDAESSGMVGEIFKAAFTDYDIILTDISIEEIKDKIMAGEAECAVVMEGLTSYTYYVKNLSMYDTNSALITEALTEIYRLNAMISGGISPEDASAIISAQIQSNTVNLGKDQIKNILYTYIMIFALYMVIMLYGQMIATNVATEKSSRAMELLITSAKPTSMMFGKVVASCLAGLIQLIAIFGSALLFYRLNSGFWSDNVIMGSIFNIPIDLFLYMLLFFILGFSIYAFLYGAIGSTASKLEDVQTSVMPVTMLFIIGFFVVIFSMMGSNVDSILLKICSYIPFTSPMAMFTRIAMSVVPWYEIFISVMILVGSAVGIGFLSAKIYRAGVLMYGNRPKLIDIFKTVFKA